MTPSNPSVSTGPATPAGPANPVGPATPVGPANPVGPATPAAPTHPCARCGAPVGPGVGLCERCNPLGLRDSAASQVHGTVFVTVAIAIVLLIVFARLTLAGSGPFPASISGVTPTDNGLAVTLTVTNEGASAGQTTCRIVDVADRGVSRSAFVLSPRIEAGQTLGFPAVVTEFGPDARELAVTCRTP